jgi:hypothetical protein
VIGEQLLRQRLVASEDQAARIAACVGQVQQLQITDDVLIEGRNTREGLHQVENDVGLEESGDRSNAPRVVTDPQHPHFMTHLAQRLDDVVLHLPLGLENVDAGGVLGWHEVVVNEGEHAQLLHRCSRLTRTGDGRRCASSSSPAR